MIQSFSEQVMSQPTRLLKPLRDARTVGFGLIASFEATKGVERPRWFAFLNPAKDLPLLPGYRVGEAGTSEGRRPESPSSLRRSSAGEPILQQLE